jgi:Tat protein secretion system quality control protein TatD with DNase activity
VDAYVGEHANHLLNHRSVRFPSFDRLWDTHDVRDDVWVICGVHPCDVAGIEGVIAFLHEREEVCGPASVG